MPWRNWLPGFLERPAARPRTNAKVRLLIEVLERRELPSATIVTDKLDYPPGDIATLQGSGFQAGETVQVQVVQLSGLCPGEIYTPWLVTDGGTGDLDGLQDGHITTTWLVPSDALGAALQVTAT